MVNCYVEIHTKCVDKEPVPVNVLVQPKTSLEQTTHFLGNSLRVIKKGT